MKNYLQRGGDGFEWATYEQAMAALMRRRMDAKDDDLEVALLFIVRALKIIMDKLPDNGR